MSADKENSAPPHVFKTPLRSSAVKRSAASSDSGSATPCTPVNKKLKSLNIPASPFLERLGYGTGGPLSDETNLSLYSQCDICYVKLHSLYIPVPDGPYLIIEL